MKVIIKATIFVLVFLMIFSLNHRCTNGSSYYWIPLNDNLPIPKVSDIIIDPIDSQIIYLVTDKAGIYKTINGGENWVQINKGLEGYDIFQISVDSKNPNIVFAGSYGVFKSDNRGDSWAQLDLNVSSKVSCLRIDPLKSNIIYVVTEEEGIFKSEDSGKTWTSVNKGIGAEGSTRLPKINCIVFNPTNSLIVYAFSNEGVFKSTDGGKNWQQVNNGLPQKVTVTIKDMYGHEFEQEGEATPVVYSGIVSLSNPSNIYLGTNFGVFVTEDAGENWKKMPGLEGLTVLKVFASSKLDKIIALTDRGIYLSSDLCNNWQQIGKSFLGKSINSVAVNFTEPMKIYLATDEGIFKSDDGGNVFQPRNKNLVFLNLLHLISGSSDEEIYASASGDGLFKLSISESHWTPIKNGLEDVSILSILADPLNKSNIFVGTDDGVYISNNGGESFDKSLKKLEGRKIYSLVRVSPQIIIAGTSEGIFRSIDNGLKWDPSNSGIDDKGWFSATTLAVDLKKPSLVYAGTVDRGIFKSENSGESWLSLNNNLETPYAPINVIRTDPENSSIIYLGTEGNGLLKSENGGLSWRKLETVPSPWVKDMAINISNTKSIFIVLYPSLILESSDAGGTWNDITFNLASKDISSVVFAGRILFVGTKTGIYKLIASYTLTASSSAGGTISPSGIINVSTGESKTFLITPNAGYKVKDVRIDGASVGSVSSYTFLNVTSDHTISALFEKEISTIATTIVLQIDKKNFTVNGSTRTLDSPPIIKNSRTLLPIRAVVEALGGTVSWDAAERKVTVSLGSTTIELWIGKSIAKINGIDSPIDPANSKVVPEIINGRTMLPLRFVTENLGCDVIWDGTTKTITIIYKH